MGVAPRVVDLPADLEAAFRAAPQAARTLEVLAYSHKQEYVRWIEDAKREPTRSARVARAIEKLTHGEKPR